MDKPKVKDGNRTINFCIPVAVTLLVFLPCCLLMKPLATLVAATIIVSVLGFLCWDSRSGRRGMNKPYVVIGRVVARHIKLAIKLGIGIILFVGGVSAILGMNSVKIPKTGGGPESEQLSGFINQVTAPLQWLWTGFIGFLGVFSLAAVFGIDWAADSVNAHPRQWALAAVITYLAWLVVTVIHIVDEEMTGTPSSPSTKETKAMWSLLTLITWAAIVLSVPRVVPPAVHFLR